MFCVSTIICVLCTCRIGEVVLLNRKSLVWKHLIRILELLWVNTVFFLCGSTKSLSPLSVETIANLPRVTSFGLSRTGLSPCTNFQFYHWVPQ